MTKTDTLGAGLVLGLALSVASTVLLLRALAERNAVIQTALREWSYAASYPSSLARQAALPSWLHRYNWHRPHMSLAAKPPISRLPLHEDNLMRRHNYSRWRAWLISRCAERILGLGRMGLDGAVVLPDSGGVVSALERMCSGTSSACWHRRTRKRSFNQLTMRCVDRLPSDLTLPHDQPDQPGPSRHGVQP